MQHVPEYTAPEKFSISVGFLTSRVYVWRSTWEFAYPRESIRECTLFDHFEEEKQLHTVEMMHGAVLMLTAADVASLFTGDRSQTILPK